MRMIHSCLRVLDLERSLAFYAEVLGLTEHARYAFEAFTLVYLRAPGCNFELELTLNHDRTLPYEVGDGYGHLALVTDQLESTLSKYNAVAEHPGEIKALEHEGRLLGRFFFATDPDGYKVEILERSGRFS